MLATDVFGFPGRLARKLRVWESRNLKYVQITVGSVVFRWATGRKQYLLPPKYVYLTTWQLL